MLACQVREHKNRLGEFHQIFNFGALGDQNELSSFWVKTSKVSIVNATNMVKKAEIKC